MRHGIAAAVAFKALRGDVRAAQEVGDRVQGRPAQEITLGGATAAGRQVVVRVLYGARLGEEKVVTIAGVKAGVAGSNLKMIDGGCTPSAEDTKLLAMPEATDKKQ